MLLLFVENASVKMHLLFVENASVKMHLLFVNNASVKMLLAKSDYVASANVSQSWYNFSS